ncbi:hypothetical protein QUF94_01785 [Peribacillus sp. NJ4]|uniref:hypothetical protein n=1 Tax=Peribacillus TaxID=2675229 RepID=UPI0025A2DC9A|nr:MULTISPECIES: hypothetical protein [unclassified Peribacillus]MDM5210201.1 hypothetical protein [Peribacillus sp. NJ4]MDM5220486.1 hypothetical protein [Peribacillus sp. NJ11]
MIDINMKVQPSFYDDECAIVFSFSFDKATRNIGEAVVYTCKKSDGKEYSQDHIDTDVQEKIAYIKEFSIVDEYQATSMKKIQHFLNVIGIKKCVRQNLNGNEIAF